MVVAHRFEYSAECRLITVINQGLVVEQGSHDELLMDPNGAYAQLIKLHELNQDSDLQTLKDPMSMVVEYQLDEQTESGQLKDRVSSDQICGDNSYSESFKSPTVIEMLGAKAKESSALEPPQRCEVPLSHLAYLNKPEFLVILLGVIAAIASGLILLFFGVLLGTIINTLYEPPQKLRKDSNFWSLMFLILAFTTIVSFPARTYLFSIAGSKLIKIIWLMSFDKAVHMEVGWFDKPENSSTTVGARLLSDAATIQSLVGNALALLVQNVSTLLASLVISFIAYWQLALIILLMIPVVGLSGWIQMKFMKGFNLHARESMASELQSREVNWQRTELMQ